MSHKNVHYQKLETEESDLEDDELPPSHVKLQNTNHVKGDRWNHIDNLDLFFKRVYQYHQNHGLWAIALTDVMELFQFLFIVCFSVFIVTCLRFNRLLTDKITYVKDNVTNERDVMFGDLFDESRLFHMSGVLVFVLLVAMVFWLHRVYHTIRRFLQFWEIRTFYHHALDVSSSEMRNVTWGEILVRLKQAQKDHKMNIRKQDLTELDVYNRILRFQNYLVAMINKHVLPCKLHIPLYGEKIFFTHGLKFNYEILLFWGPGAPFRNSFYLHEDYKSATKKYDLISRLRFRIAVLALLNLLFCPVIFLYQILYSFFHYAEILKRHPGVFGKRRWSLYGRYELRDFNELDHELTLRLNRAYLPSVKYMDLFTHPIVTILAQNVAFVAGSILAVLVVMTVMQEDLLTAHNVLTFITLLGIIVTACRVFIPEENQAWIPAELMQDILGDIHYMPDKWKQQPHTVQVYKEFTQVFQFTLMYILDEMFSPLITPFILFFSLRERAPQIIDFLRNFTIDVSGVGDVCSFAEMNIKKHGNSEWLTPGMTRAGDYEKAELGKTEISLVQFSRKNPNWKPSEDGTLFMSQLKESVDEMQRSQTSVLPVGFPPVYPTLPQSTDTHLQDIVGGRVTPTAPPPPHHHPITTHLLSPPPPHHHTHSTIPPPPPPPSPPQQGMQWSVWSVNGGIHQPQYLSLAHHHHISSSRSDPLIVSTLQLHQIHDYRKAIQSSSVYTPLLQPPPPPLVVGDTVKHPLSSVHTTPEQTAIDTDCTSGIRTPPPPPPSSSSFSSASSNWSPIPGGIVGRGTGERDTSQSLSRGKERQLVVENTSCTDMTRRDNSQEREGDEGGGGSGGSATALNMHDSSSQL